MKKLLLFTILIFTLGSTTHAQVLVQSAVHSGAINWYPLTVHSATLPNPVTAGDFLVVFMRNCNFATTPAQPFVDSQANLWKDATIYHDKWYVESAIGGPLTLTFSYAQPNYCQFAIADFRGSWVLDVVSHPLYSDNVTDGTSYSITPSQSGELILGFGIDDCGCAGGYDPAVSPGPGFQFAALTVPLYIEYMVQPIAAPIMATDHHAAPVDTIITVAAFKPKPTGCQIVQ
jgi:hypothetical protein